MGKSVTAEKLLNTELDPHIKIRAPLRCDGVGSLDCAEDVESGMRMAVRWLPLDANGAAAARAVEALPSHPTLPKIRSTGRVGSAAFVAMDFPDGKLLSTMVGERFNPGQVAKIGSEIADALATMHAQDVVHGELSADSVLLHGSKAILWDMPLVLANRLTDRRGEERMLSQLPRIAPYIAPERARGVPAFSSGDIFALGAVMAQLLGGKQPQAQSTLALIHQLGTGAWKPELPETTPPQLRALMSRMLQSEPRLRPSAREVADQLRIAFLTPSVTDPELASIHASQLAELVADEMAVEPPPPAPEVDLGPPPVLTPALVAASAEPVPPPGVAAPQPSAIVPVEMRAQPAPANPEAVPAGVRAAPPAARRFKAPWLIASAVASASILVLSGLLYFSPRQQSETSPVMSNDVFAVAPNTLLADEADLIEPLVPEDDFEPHADPAWVASAEAPFEVKEEQPPQSALAVAGKQAPKAEKKTARQKPAKKGAVKAVESRPVVQEAPVQEQKAHELQSFDFLEKNTPPPSGELKRPSF